MCPLSTTFTRAYCMGAQQGAVCVPSRAMVLTGRTLFRIQDQLKGQTTWQELRKLRTIQA